MLSQEKPQPPSSSLQVKAPEMKGNRGLEGMLLGLTMSGVNWEIVGTLGACGRLGRITDAESNKA